MSDPENSPSTTGIDLGGGGAGALWLLFEKRQEIRTAPGDRLQTNGHFGKDGLQEEPHTFSCLVTRCLCSNCDRCSLDASGT